jgi:Fur family ferric uptake transcriptional regulator
MSSVDAAQQLRARGHRVTTQRRLVLEAVAALGHATPEQIHGAISPPVDLSTVYRTLELLESVELVHHTHFGHGSPSYSAAATADHLHLVCRECAGVAEAQPSVLADLVRTLERENGFAVDVEHVALTGRCADCRRRHTDTHT